MKQEVQVYILELLKLLKGKFAKDARNPSFQVGEDGRLWLWIPIDDIFQSIIFDEEYEDKSPKEVFDGIINSLSEAGYEIPID